tara:strand:+ start:502663 stop:505032 length:2370 start_codon:yes stop_codon:yes gene_type:complete
MIVKKLLVYFVIFAFCSVIHAQEKQLQNYAKARIYFASTSDFEKLSQSGVSLDHGIKKSKGYVESVFSSTEIETSKKLGFKVEILVDDIQKQYAENAKRSIQKNGVACDPKIGNYPTPTNFNLGTMGGFLTHTEIQQELDAMRTLYPNLITARANIGTFSTQNSNSIQWVKISDNADTDETEPQVLYTALHHAREPISMQQLIYFMWYLLENYATDTEIKGIVDATELYFIPVVNPDGYLYNESTNPTGNGQWRKNRKNNGNGTFGVDNNRNYDYIDGGGNSVWNTSGTSNNTSAENYAGTAPFSEVENQAIKWFVEQRDFKIALNNHSFGNLILYPFGYQNLFPTTDNSTFDIISKELVQQNEFANIMSANLYPAAGDSDDFMYGETSTHSEIIAFTPEIGDSFWPAQGSIIALCKSMVYTNLIAAHSVSNYALITDTEPNYLNGTSGSFDYRIKRIGINSGPSNFTVTVVPVTSNIQSVGVANQHTNLSLLENRSGAINYTLNSSIGIGELVTYKLIIDSGTSITEKSITKVFGIPQVLLSENGDNLSNWNGSWNTTTSDFVSASSSITDSPATNYGSNQNKTLEHTANIDLSTAGLASISFFTKWDIEAGFDYVQFEVSTNNGVTWQPQCGQFTRSGVVDQGIIGQPMYDGTQNEWVQEFIDLSDYLGETINVRFQLVSDSNVVKDGFYFDDFTVHVIDQSVLGTTGYETLNAQLYPNPVNNNLTISLSNPILTQIHIYAVTGQLVRKLETDTLTTEIDLSKLKTGVYIVQLQTETTNSTYKIIKE